MDFSLMLILFNRRGFHLFCLYALFHWTQSRVCNDQTYSCAHLHCRVLLYQAQTCSYGIPFSEINVELHTAFKSERLGNIMPGFSTRMFLLFSVETTYIVSQIIIITTILIVIIITRLLATTVIITVARG